MKSKKRRKGLYLLGESVRGIKRREAGLKSELNGLSYN